MFHTVGRVVVGNDCDWEINPIGAFITRLVKKVVLTPFQNRRMARTTVEWSFDIETDEVYLVLLMHICDVST